MVAVDQVTAYTVHGKQYEQTHGNAFDRGSADSYYNRPRDPHMWPEGTYKGTRVEAVAMSADELEAYNEAYGDKKSWD